MSRLVAFAAIQGGYNIVSKVEGRYTQALQTYNADTKIGFPNTAYFLPVIYSLTGMKVETLEDAKKPLDFARGLLPPHVKGHNHIPYLGPLLDAGKAEFCDRHGLGEASYALFQAVLEIGRRYLQAEISRTDCFDNPAATRRFLASRLRHLPHEVFACLMLDNRHRLISFEELFRGTIDGASVQPREVVRRALTHNAAAMILAHNHPSGVAEPSDADRRITRHIREALDLIDVRLLDHIVVGDGEMSSLAEMGWI